MLSASSLVSKVRTRVGDSTVYIYMYSCTVCVFSCIEGDEVRESGLMCVGMVRTAGSRSVEPATVVVCVRSLVR